MHFMEKSISESMKGVYMNEIIQNILTRRSVRTFQEEQIKDEDLTDILEAAKYAPSAMGKQGWHFSVVQNTEMIQALTLAIKEALVESPNEQFQKMGSNPNFNPFYNAPTIIITSYEKDAIAGVADCSVALENIFLAANSLNIGSCWINILAFVANHPKVREQLTQLGVPSDYELSGTASLGYSSKEPAKAAPRKEGTVNIVK